MISVERVNDLPIWSDGPRLETPTLERPGTRYVLAAAGVWAFVLASVFADRYTTAYGLEMGAREVNPVGNAILAWLGPHWMAIPKAIVIGLTAVASTTLYATGDPYRSSLWIPGLVGGLWMAAAAWNTLQIMGAHP